MEMSTEKQVDMLRKMWLIRCFEEAAIRLYKEGYFRGSTHPYIAQEATAVGVCAALGHRDMVLATHRGHGACIAKGSDTKRMMAEVLNKVTGLCKGKGGSMHLSDTGIGLLVCTGVVGAHIPIAGGVALANQLAGNDVVTVCFFGDGASCEGVFYETCNMAALWKLPLLLVVENNEYAVSVHVSQSVSVAQISTRALGFGMPGVTVDGCDVYSVYDAACSAVQRARRGEGPTLLEARTVRWTRHSVVQAGGSATQKERWRDFDPIPRYIRELVSRGIISDSQAAAIETEARQEIAEAVDFAVNSPDPEPEDIYADIFA